MSKLLLEYKKELAVRNASPDLSGSNNMFGTIAHNSIPVPVTKDFIPNGFNGEIIELTGDTSAKWLGLNNPTMQYQAYGYCSPLGAVIDRLAEADTNGRIEMLNLDRTTFTNYKKNPILNRIMKLLKNPNPWQTWEEFNSEQVVLCKIFGYCPVWAISPKGMDKSYTKALINLNAYYFRPTRNINFNAFKPETGGAILEWTGTVHGQNLTIPASDIMLLKDGYIESTRNGMTLPISKIEGLDYFVSNICAAMEADNVLLKKKGPLGVFSHDPKSDIGGYQPLSTPDKQDLQNDLRQYGLSWGQLQYVVSKQPLKWNAMSFNLRDLMTKETVRQGIDGICDRMGYPAELMSGKNATYENRSSAEKFLYQNNVIPFSLRRMARYDSFFGIEDIARLNLDYDHLPVLQEDSMSAGNAFKLLTEGLDVAWKGGMITWNEWREQQDMDTVSGMDIYFPEWAKANGIELNPTKEKKNEKAPKNTGATKA